MVNPVEAEPLFLAFNELRFDDAGWRDIFKSALTGPTLDADAINPPDLYCETNTSTEVTVNFDMRIKRPVNDHPNIFDSSLTVSKNLAMLVLAFEGEIDKLLPDHRGYVTQSVCWQFLDPEHLTINQVTDFFFPGICSLQCLQHHLESSHSQEKAPQALVMRFHSGIGHHHVPWRWRRQLSRPRGIRIPIPIQLHSVVTLHHAVLSVPAASWKPGRTGDSALGRVHGERSVTSRSDLGTGSAAAGALRGQVLGQSD